MKKILVIDDEKDFTELIKTTLEIRGHYEVRMENDMSLALDTVRTFKPDLILLDLMAPGNINGGEIAGMIKNDPKIKNTPIVFVTAAITEKEVTSMGGVIGGHPFIAKPVNIKDLVNNIEKILS